MKYTFFVDFDGTITRRDTCIAMSETFAKGDWKSIEGEWARGLITTVQSARRIFDLYDASRSELLELLNSIDIDEFFIPFLNICEGGDYGLYILSDGYDINIKTVFDRHGIGDIPIYSNELIIEGRRFDIRTPHASKVCDDCGTCKAELVEKLKPSQGISVYIGDGYSDTCGCEKADVVFAKDTLLEYRRARHLPAIPFEDFGDIISWIKGSGDA